jgi:protein SCO1/2
LLVGILAACSSVGPVKTLPSQLNDQSGGGTYQGVGLDPAQPRPSFTLTDTTGKPFSFGERTAGHPTLLYFGYTTCPDVCPATMADISLALKSLPAALQRATDVVFVSTDVKHDTGPIITQWLSNFAPNTTATFTGLRGTQAQIDAAQTAAHVIVAQDGGQTHSAEVLLYGSDDYARVSYPQSANEQLQIAHDLPLVSHS